jgi:hypothetical protein
MARADPGDSNPIMNNWGGAQEFPARFWWSGPSQGNLHEPQTFPTPSLSHYLKKKKITKKGWGSGLSDKKK